jgi:hypothetical protein
MNKGDSVAIKRSSGYYGQHLGYGVIVEKLISGSLPILVRWEDGYKNTYSESDLIVNNEWDK